MGLYAGFYSSLKSPPSWPRQVWVARMQLMNAMADEITFIGRAIDPPLMLHFLLLFSIFENRYVLLLCDNYFSNCCWEIRNFSTFYLFWNPEWLWRVRKLVCFPIFPLGTQMIGKRDPWAFFLTSQLIGSRDSRSLPGDLQQASITLCEYIYSIHPFFHIDKVI